MKHARTSSFMDKAIRNTYMRAKYMANRKENIARFEELMGSIARDGKDELMDYIKNKTDFYMAPASTQFHLACDGGLLQHSLNVYDCLVAKKSSSISNKVKGTYLVAVVHLKALIFRMELQRLKIMYSMATVR